MSRSFVYPVFNMKLGCYQIYLITRIIIGRNHILSYDTRNASSLHVPKFKTNIRRFSFQYQGPLFFNSLSPDILSSVSVLTFKKNLKKHLLA